MAAFKTITTGDDWQDKTYYREIEQGIYERFVGGNASGCPAWATASGSTSSGDDIQSAAFWAARQNAFATLISNAAIPFVRIGATGAPPSDIATLLPILTGAGGVPTLFTSAAQLWALVNGGSGPRRRTAMSGGYSYGTCAAGDIIGPWLIEDLQMACRFLRYGWMGPSFATSGTPWSNFDQTMNYAVYSLHPPYIGEPWTWNWVAAFNYWDANKTMALFFNDISPYFWPDVGNAIAGYRFRIYQYYNERAGGGGGWDYYHLTWLRVSARQVKGDTDVSTALSKRFRLTAKIASTNFYIPGNPYRDWHGTSSAGSYVQLGLSDYTMAASHWFDGKTMKSVAWDRTFTVGSYGGDVNWACELADPGIVTDFAWSRT